MFGRRSKQQVEDVLGQAALASGLRLQSRSNLPGCLSNLEQALASFGSPPNNQPKYLVPAGYRWLSSDPAPSYAVCFDTQDGHPVLVPLWSQPGETLIGAFTLGGGDARLAELNPVIDAWSRQDPSLTTAGIFPERSVALAAPPFMPEILADTLQQLGLPVTPANTAAMQEEFRFGMTIKAFEFINSQDRSFAQQFVKAHQQSHPQAILEDLANWNKGVVPYIQSMPAFIQSFIAEHGKQGLQQRYQT